VSGFDDVKATVFARMPPVHIPRLDNYLKNNINFERGMEFANGYG